MTKTPTETLMQSAHGYQKSKKSTEVIAETLKVHCIHVVIK
jgi:hypothetical protein